MTEVSRIWLPDVEKGLYVPVGRLVQRVRRTRDLNQAEAAEKIGIPASALSAIEANRRPVRTVPMSMRLADGLSLPRLQLIEWVIREVEYVNPKLRHRN
ncbi:helix-turn-helix domain-containing protein [Amycolatopsis sp. CA-126428]|uniref:helix-turn-helix domain-containing protein n=1 Tax=Amycolatopsis sp. CA-126428 TaxID=2073158 RepID=UPI000CD11E53|nr:helix-turn-helix transcriptional regulator [Amycolatopsis sp. CA-126428]